MERIIDMLRASGADGWAVRDEIREGWEFYFIRHALDQNRVRNTEHITLTVYKKSDDGAFLGSASAELHPTASDAEAGKLIEDLTADAGLVKNPFYTLNEPREAEEAPEQAGPDVYEQAKGFIEAMAAVPETATEDLNSYEIFTDKVTSRLITSTGIDVTSVYPDSMVEVVVNARNSGHEIELYRLYRMGGCDAENLKGDVCKTLRYGRDKLAAGKTPALGTCDVVFSTDAACEIYRYFIDRMGAGMKYRKISDWEIGKPVVAKAAEDLVTVRALRRLDNSSHNNAYDSEGAPVRDLVLIRDGVAEAMYGSRMFAEYIGLKDSFVPGNFAVEGGSRSAGELRSGRYLEIVEFSDFQVNSMNGDIAGEIRLGYLHDGDTVKIVEGGSVSGTMAELAGHMMMSKEQHQYNNLLIPAVTRLQGVSITGAE